MTVEEAIKDIEGLLDDTHYHLLGSHQDCLQLGIEALKRVKSAREDGGYGSWYLLKGETEK